MIYSGRFGNPFCYLDKATVSSGAAYKLPICPNLLGKTKSQADPPLAVQMTILLSPLPPTVRKMNFVIQK